MKVIVISGPTATGKTDIGIEIAKMTQAEVVNFDSLLLYKEISIGTAKPSVNERKIIPHHMIDVRSISDAMNAADYAKEAYIKIKEIDSRNKIPILVGGSGFYLQALLKGMYASETTTPEIINKSETLYNEKGIQPFVDVLKKHDLESLNRYHENDHYRIRRAVEHWWMTGIPLSKVRQYKDQANTKLSGPTIHDWNILHIYLDLPKDEHHKIIEERTEKMLSEGLVEEVKNLIKSGFTGSEKPLQSIGYKETLNYIFGVYKSLDECKEKIIISTRQLAKSQRTWFKRDLHKELYHPLKERNKIFLRVESFLKSN